MARVYDYVQEEVNGFDIIVQNYATGPVSADGEVDFSLLPSLGEVRARLESSLIAFAENQNESFSYDLSGIHEDADLANFAFSFSGQIPTYWSIEGQLKGTVPALSLTPELEAFFEQAPFDSVDFQMFVDGLTGVQGVQAFRNMFYGQSPQQRNEDGSSGVYFYLFETILNIPL